MFNKFIFSSFEKNFKNFSVTILTTYNLLSFQTQHNKISSLCIKWQFQLSLFTFEIKLYQNFHFIAEASLLCSIQYWHFKAIVFGTMPITHPYLVAIPLLLPLLFVLTLPVLGGLRCPSVPAVILVGVGVVLRSIGWSIFSSLHIRQVFITWTIKNYINLLRQ